MSRRHAIGAVAGALLVTWGMAAAAAAPDRARQSAALPDWSGIWVSTDIDIDISGYPTAGPGALNLKLMGSTAAVRPEQRARMAELIAALAADAGRKSQGWGYPGMMEGAAPLQFLVTPEETLILNFYRDIRHVYTDGRGHLPEEDRWPVPWGDSIGHWEGDTLVIETVSVQIGAALPMVIPLSEKTRFIERIRRTGPDRMELEMRVEDPEVLSEPWVVKVQYQQARGVDRLIHNLFENDRTESKGDSMTITPP